MKVKGYLRWRSWNMCTDTMKCVSNNTKKKKSFSEFKKKELTERDHVACWGVRRNSKPPIEPCAIFVLFFSSPTFSCLNFWTTISTVGRKKNSFSYFIRKTRFYISSLKTSWQRLNDGQSKVQGLIKFSFWEGKTKFFNVGHVFPDVFVCVSDQLSKYIYLEVFKGGGVKQMVSLLWT